MSIEGQGHFLTIYFPGFVCFMLYLAKISGVRLQDHWSSGSLRDEVERCYNIASSVDPSLSLCVCVCMCMCVCVCVCV